MIIKIGHFLSYPVLVKKRVVMPVAYGTPDPAGGFFLFFSLIGAPSHRTWPLSPPGYPLPFSIAGARSPRTWPLSPRGYPLPFSVVGGPSPLGYPHSIFQELSSKILIYP